MQYLCLVSQQITALRAENTSEVQNGNRAKSDLIWSSIKHFQISTLLLNSYPTHVISFLLIACIVGDQCFKL